MQARAIAHYFFLFINPYDHKGASFPEESFYLFNVPNLNS